LALIAVLLGAVGFLAYQRFSNSESSQPDLPRIWIPQGNSQTITGQASVIDGDTIEINRTRIRLHGIDAPESGQICKTAERKEYLCGQQAAFALSDKIKGRVVECRKKDLDRYSRIVAVCLVSGEDVNGWMVAQGWAAAYRQYSMDYVGQEARAKNLRLGIWQGEFEAPWDWRRNHRRPTAFQFASAIGF
jgi:endonuclease YncB( thermonuclease family)